MTMAWSWKLLPAIQFITEESRKDVAANESRFTVSSDAVYTLIEIDWWLMLLYVIMFSVTVNVVRNSKCCPMSCIFQMVEFSAGRLNCPTDCLCFAVVVPRRNKLTGVRPYGGDKAVSADSGVGLSPVLTVCCQCRFWRGLVCCPDCPPCWQAAIYSMTRVTFVYSCVP
jgi:hypothetical protein